MWWLSNIILFSNRWAKRIAVLCTALMSLAIIMQILSRNIFNISFSWAEEISRYLFIWATFLGVGYAFHNNSSISIDILITRLPDRAKKYAEIVIGFLCLIFLIILTYHGFRLCIRTTGQTSPALNLPMNFVYLVIPISGLLQILNLFDTTWKSINKEIQGV